jgi:hypothetical protein
MDEALTLKKHPLNVGAAAPKNSIYSPVFSIVFATAVAEEKYDPPVLSIVYVSS